FSRFAQHSGQPKITQKPLEEYNYVIPPKEEQIKFAQIVEQINKQKFVGTKIARLLVKIVILC
ncbi:MAG: restriction endonuclease subunit S, partial [Bacilli bacterium]|nr:restriction endonuclease subunit S [Bacilli bacterium]